MLYYLCTYIYAGLKTTIYIYKIKNYYLYYNSSSCVCLSFLSIILPHSLSTWPFFIIIKVLKRCSMFESWQIFGACMIICKQTFLPQNSLNTDVILNDSTSDTLSRSINMLLRCMNVSIWNRCFILMKSKMIVYTIT